VHVSTAALLAKEVRDGTSVGRTALRYMDPGLLVPDQLVVRLVTAELRRRDDARRVPGGFVLSGFPRTIRQAEALDALICTAPVGLVVGLRPSVAVEPGWLRRDRSPFERTRAQRALSLYRLLTEPALAWMARRHPFVSIDADAPRCATASASGVVSRPGASTAPALPAAGCTQDRARPRPGAVSAARTGAPDDGGPSPT
jgi:adenylate kinase family enzyme